MLTLKQTQREKGSVMRTMKKEMIVRTQPHNPIPVSSSSAAIVALSCVHLVSLVVVTKYRDFPGSLC